MIATREMCFSVGGSYDYGAGYWPTSDVEPFATFINSTHKHVATSSELNQPWNNTSVMTKPPTGYVRDLKQQPGGDIGIHASTELARGLIRARLADHLRFVVPATIAGHGKRLFDDDAGDGLQQLELIDVEQTPRGTLFLHYCVWPAP